MAIDIEPNSIDNTYGSSPQAPITGNLHSPVLQNVTATLPNNLLYKTDSNYGQNTSIPNNQQPKDTSNNAQSLAKTVKTNNNPSFAAPTNPTAASQPAGEILTVVKAADPSNLGGVVVKALDAMIMLKMMSSLTSPSGTSNMLTGALGSALQQYAGQVGLVAALSSINAAMPIIAPQLSLNNSIVLNNAINSMITGVAVGALATTAVATATALSGTITSAVASNNPALIAGVAGTIGGPALGVAPNTLASQIVGAAVGSTIATTAVIAGATIGTNILINSNAIQSQLSTVPSLTGMEPINIATAAASGIVTGLSTLGAIALPSLMAAAQSNIITAGLTTLFGVGLSGLMGVASTVIPNIASSITSALSSHTPLTALNPGLMTTALQNSVRALALGQLALNIANIFTPHTSEQAVTVSLSLGTATASMPIGTTLTSTLATGVTISTTRIS